MTSIPLVDPHAPKADPSIGDLVKDATSQVSTLVRAEVELARAEITRDVKKGLTGSVYFILALVVLFYSTFFFFFFVAELLDNWIWRWAAFLIVFGLMVLTTIVFALLGWLKVRKIRGPQTDHRNGQGNPGRPDARWRQARQQGDRQQRRRAVQAALRSLGLVDGPGRRRRRFETPARSVGDPHRGSVATLEVHANGIRFHVVEADPHDDDPDPPKIDPW